MGNCRVPTQHARVHPGHAQWVNLGKKMSEFYQKLFFMRFGAFVVFYNYLFQIGQNFSYFGTFFSHSVMYSLSRKNHIFSTLLANFPTFSFPAGRGENVRNV